MQGLQIIKDQRWKQETLPDGLVGVCAAFAPEVSILQELLCVSCSRFCLIDEVAVQPWVICIFKPVTWVPTTGCRFHMASATVKPKPSRIQRCKITLE